MMDNLTALTYLPQDQLSLAYLHEVRELNRYRGLALSFLPFDPPISRLMDAIGMECVHRLCSLQEVASQMELGACANANQQKEPPFFNKVNKHLFVVDENMGKYLLANAEKSAEATCTFFGWLLETNATPELHQPLFDFVTQKTKECLVLRECREQWGVGSSELSLAM
ncbi:hypothetical protein [Halomonas sp. KO116]|uniref:hypothetical protein n=1 Tax=Halomonas sp. KO116 TaxID=1504981 RepID=UPI0004E30911|nr:hypothetical protein [Halomonas sp. KO116]AJY50921.1 hypothetical protein KO116_02446 [Halomonas sp. KO116]